jgi:hypothetical protein
MRLWKFHCMENKWPGLWQRWFVEQCVSVGWPTEDGWSMEGGAKSSGWSRARNTLKKMQRGDYVAVTLNHHRIAMIGQIFDFKLDDWAPMVPPSKKYPSGEMGRKVLVRWDLTAGPGDRSTVVSLPKNLQLTRGELRPTVCEIKSHTVEEFQKAMKNEANWIGLWSHFEHERALSGYIAAYPHRLEDGLLPYPDEKIRERIFHDGRRLDVLLIDREGCPVIVECKQGPPTASNADQLLRYLRNLRSELGREKKLRGILVHGGSKNLDLAMRKKLKSHPEIETVQYRLDLDFAASN